MQSLVVLVLPTPNRCCRSNYRDRPNPPVLCIALANQQTLSWGRSPHRRMIDTRVCDTRCVQPHQSWPHRLRFRRGVRLALDLDGLGVRLPRRENRRGMGQAILSTAHLPGQVPPDATPTLDRPRALIRSWSPSQHDGHESRLPTGSTPVNASRGNPPSLLTRVYVHSHSTPPVTPWQGCECAAFPPIISGSCDDRPGLRAGLDRERDG